MNSNERAQLRAAGQHDASFPEVTTADLTLYCNYGLGNDLCGKGTVGQPYKTPNRAMQDVAHRIAHKVKIVLGGPATYAAGSFPRKVDNVLEGDGSLTFYGVGAPTKKTVNGGPHVVASVADIEQVGQRVTVAAAAWAADEFCGYWLRVVTGTHVGVAFPIFGNGAGTIKIEQQADRVHAGDTVEIIRPSIWVEVDDLDIFYDAHSFAENPVSYGSSHLTFANIYFDASASASLYGQFKFHGGGLSDGPVFDFVRFDALAMGVFFENTHLNYWQPIDDTYVAACGAGIVNMAGYGTTAGYSLWSAGVRADVLVYLYGDTFLQHAAISGQVEAAQCSFSKIAGGVASFKNWTGGGELGVVVAGVNATTPGVFLQGGIWTAVDACVEGACNYAVDTDGGAIVRIHGDCTCSATLCDKSAVRIGPMCKVTTDHALAGFLGKTAGQEAYICAMAAGVKAATWPAAGTYVTDAKGGEFLRVS